jgi:hypothetical protein
MRFHENACNSACDRRTRKHRDELALPTARRAASARQLHRVRCVEYNRASGSRMIASDRMSEIRLL